MTEGRKFWALVNPELSPDYNPEKTFGQVRCILKTKWIEMPTVGMSVPKTVCFVLQWLINEKERGGPESLTAGSGRNFCIQMAGEVSHFLIYQ